MTELTDTKDNVCCDALMKMSIAWMQVDNGVLCMPHIRGHSDDQLWRVNYCPSCGAYIREIMTERPKE